MAELLGHAQSDPTLAAMWRERWLQPRRDATAVVLGRGIERGQIRRDVTLGVLMDELYGPLYYRLLARHEPLDDAFARELVANTLRGSDPTSCSKSLIGIESGCSRIKKTACLRRDTPFL